MLAHLGSGAGIYVLAAQCLLHASEALLAPGNHAATHRPAENKMLGDSDGETSCWLLRLHRKPYI